jgi:hypothetical protein
MPYSVVYVSPYDKHGQGRGVCLVLDSLPFLRTDVDGSDSASDAGGGSKR